MDVFTIIFTAAIVVEAQIQVLKTWVPEAVNMASCVWPVASACFGILVCILAGIDVFGVLGVDLSVPVIGSVLSGILISRGSNFVHDLWGSQKNPE